jgi:23S rRNA pseudouridine2604 synthase
MVTAVEHDVKKLKRIRVENIYLGDLAEGEWRRFTDVEKRGVLERINEN